MTMKHGKPTKTKTSLHYDPALDYVREENRILRLILAAMKKYPNCRKLFC